MVNELIYVLWIAVGTTGFWESVNGLQRFRILKKLPCWLWEIVIGIVPIVWIGIIQILLHPINLLLYSVITVSYMELLRTRHKSRWWSIPLILVQCVMYFLLPFWHAQENRFYVLMIVEIVGLLLQSLRMNPMWVMIGIGLWIFLKPYFFPAHDQWMDIVDLFGLFVPLFLYLKESAGRLRIAYERGHDALTGLMNRTSFNEWLQEFQGQRGVLAIVDLDNFKYVNDVFGHQAGDQLLVEMGERISRVIPNQASVYRWGGDEFVIVCQQPSGEEGEIWVRNMIQTVFQALEAIPSQTIPSFTIRATMGVALGEYDGRLFSQADTALLYTKRMIKNQLKWYSEDLNDKLMIENDGQETLQERDQRLRIADAVWEYAHEGMLITDLDGTILRVNRAFTKTTGFTAKEAFGKTPRLLQSGYHDKPFYQELWNQLLKKGVWEGEVINRKKNGDVYREWLQIRSIGQDEASSSYYLATFYELEKKEDNGNEDTSASSRVTGASYNT